MRAHGRRWLARALSLAQRAEVVSLDVFDTALLRPFVRPEHLFEAVGRRLRGHRSGPLCPTAFAAARRLAERAARQEALRRHGHREVTLDEIYALLSRRAVSLGLPEGDWADAKRLELTVELEHCRANPPLLELHRGLGAGSRRVVFMSDTYLDAETVAGMLRRAGYPSYERLFVSCAEKTSKLAGGLYTRALSWLRIRPDEMLHIGDNWRADVLAPRLRRIRTLRAPKLAAGRLPAVCRPIRLDDSVALGLARRGAPEPEAEPATAPWWRSLGYEVAGPIYAGLADWLTLRLATHELDAALFLARDGLRMKSLVEMSPGAVRCPLAYFLASRGPLMLASTQQFDGDTLAAMSHARAVLPVAAYLARLGLEPGEHLAAARSVGLRDLDERVATPAHSARIRRLLQQLRQPILAQGARQRAMLSRYLRQLGVERMRRIALVDIGWHGNVQRYLTGLLRLLGWRVEVFGLYVGTFEQARSVLGPASHSEGWLCDCGRPLGRYGVLKQGLELLEVIFSAPHGSVLGLTERDGELAPVLGPFDPQSAYATAAVAMQEGGLRFAEHYREVLGSTGRGLVSADVALAPLARLLERPSRDEARAVGALVHNEGFGHEPDGEQPLARAPGLAEAMRAPGELCRGLHRAYWKTGFVVQLSGHSLGVGVIMRGVYGLWGSLQRTPFGTGFERLRARVRWRS